MDGPQDKDPASTDIYSFRGFHLNPKERRLAFSGRFIDIKPKAFEILTYLVSRSGEIVTKDAILDAVWEGNFVEEGNLAVHISKLRKLFSRTGGFTFIQTLPGVGYSFVEPAAIATEDEWKEAVKDATPLIDVIALDDGRESIAVMPLFNENADTELDYLADGLTEALINNISCRPNLRVLARNTVFRFKNQDVDVKEVGKLLNVEHILTGRIRIQGENISLSVELSRVSDGSQIWGQRFDRDFSDVFEMQDSITNSICERLNTEIGKSLVDATGQANTRNGESYRLFLKARYFLMNRRALGDLKKAEKLLLQSISMDPSFAAAYIGLANCIRVQFLYHELPKKDAAQRISKLLERTYEIDPILPDYFLLKGYADMFLDFDFGKAEVCFERALSLNPGSAVAHNYLARLLIYRGDIKGGLNMASESAQLDPVSYSNDKSLAKLFLMTSQFENAAFRLEECLELSPDDFEASVLLGFAKCELGDFEEALNCFDRALSVQFHLETLAMKGYGLALAGEKKEAQKVLRVLKRESTRRIVPKSLLAVVYAGLRDTENAIRYLEQTYEDGYVDIVAIKVDPRWKQLRDDPRFRQIESKLRL